MTAPKAEEIIAEAIANCPVVLIPKCGPVVLAALRAAAPDGPGTPVVNLETGEVCLMRESHHFLEVLRIAQSDYRRERDRANALQAAADEAVG